MSTPSNDDVGRGPIARLLAADHDRLDELLERAGAVRELDLEAYEAFRAGILRHIAVEERVLFAFVKQRRGAHLAGVPLLRAEHSAIARLLCFRPDAALLDEVRKLLVPHNEREEGASGIYAQCEEIAGDDVEALAARIESFGAVRPAPYRDNDPALRSAEAALAWAMKGKGL